MTTFRTYTKQDYRDFLGIQRGHTKKWKDLYTQLNEEMVALDSVNQALVRRCLELELENWRLTREIQGNTAERPSQASEVLQGTGDGSDYVRDSGGFGEDSGPLVSS